MHIGKQGSFRILQTYQLALKVDQVYKRYLQIRDGNKYETCFRTMRTEGQSEGSSKIKIKVLFHNQINISYCQCRGHGMMDPE